MNALLTRFDVDAAQWRALVRASLYVDFAALRAANMRAVDIRAARQLAIALVITALAGLSPAVFAVMVPDILLSATYTVTIVAFMVISSLMVGEGVTILSPTDHHVLGFRPVTSRTYFAVRVACILIRTAVITTFITLPPMLVFLAKGGFHPIRALALLAAAYAAGLAATLALVGMYGWLLRVAGPTRMLRLASYLQLASQMVIWGGLILATQEMAQSSLAGLSLDGRPWAFLYPGTWFGSYVALANGDVTWLTGGAALTSIVLLLALVRALGGKLSLGYAESLGRLAAISAPLSSRDQGARQWMHFLDHETRAIAILVRSHLQNDMRFRFGLISILPITVFYLFLGGMPRDPFVAGEHRSDAVVIQMAVFFLPITLRQVLVMSEKYRASWIYFSTPADCAKLVLSARNIITLFFLLPYVLLLAGLLAYSFGNWTHALLHAFFTGMISYLILQTITLANPQLPFSLPAAKDAMAGMTFGLMMGVGIMGMVTYFLMTQLIYRTSAGMMTAALLMIALAWVMDRVTRRRAVQRFADGAFAEI